MNALERLCAACGLCCNGVLFDDVELGQGDDAERLRALGLRIGSKGRGGLLRFRQPCPAWEGCRCAIYTERPGHCRAFQCRQLRLLRGGRQTEAQALRVIRNMRRRLAVMDRLMRAFDGASTRAGRSLMKRYADAMRRPMDLHEDPEAGGRHGRLLRAMQRLMRRLESEFR